MTVAAGAAVAAARWRWVEMRPEVRVKIGVARMQVRVTGIQVSNILAHIKARRLANVQTLGSQCLASKQSKTEIWLRRSQIYLCAQIEK
jgi:hypothetical protein